MSNTREVLCAAIEKRDAVAVERHDSLEMIERAVEKLQAAMDVQAQFETVQSDIDAWRQSAVKEAIRAGKPTAGLTMPCELAERSRQRDVAAQNVVDLRRAIDGFEAEANEVKTRLDREDYQVALASEKVLIEETDTLVHQFLQNLHDVRALFLRLKYSGALLMPNDPDQPERKSPFGAVEKRSMAFTPVLRQALIENPMGDVEIRVGPSMFNQTLAATCDYFDELRKNADASFKRPGRYEYKPPVPPVDDAARAQQLQTSAAAQREERLRRAADERRGSVQLSPEARRLGYRVEGGRIVAPDETAKAAG